jgi:hypothetical protein
MGAEVWQGGEGEAGGSVGDQPDPGSPRAIPWTDEGEEAAVLAAAGAADGGRTPPDEKKLNRRAAELAGRDGIVRFGIGFGEGFVGNFNEQKDLVKAAGGWLKSTGTKVWGAWKERPVETVAVGLGALLGGAHGAHLVFEFTFGDRFAGEIAMVQQGVALVKDGGRMILEGGKVVFDAASSAGEWGPELARVLFLLLEGFINETRGLAEAELLMLVCFRGQTNYDATSHYW